MIVRCFVNIKQQANGMIDIVSAILRFGLWSKLLSLAYSQSPGVLQKDIYEGLKHGFMLKSGQLLRLLKPLYCLTDSWGYWTDMTKRHLTENIKLKPRTADLACFLKNQNSLFIRDDCNICR